MLRKLAFLFILLGVCLAYPSPARADGIIIPDPPPCAWEMCPPPPCPFDIPCPPPTPMTQLSIRYHRVKVTIQDQLAITHVDQVFYNPNDWAVEGTYIFPLPGEAAVSSFTLWVDGQPVEGEILEAEQARQKYQAIVSSLRDPALLEYAGRGAVQAHVFPIPPQGERRIELEYTQALAAENGLVRYVYPLNTEKFSAWPLENVSVEVDILASASIRAVYSPSHTIATRRETQNHVVVGYEDSQVTPASDFALYYSLGEEQALHLVTFRDPNHPDDPDGFFMLLLAPKPEIDPTPVAKDVLLVLDRSGSMEGEKFRQAQEALLYILDHLNPEDRFHLTIFSTDIETYASELRPASEAAEAKRWVESLTAEGSTDINRALLEAASLISASEGTGAQERPAYLIFLTDGLPTTGVVERNQILNNLQASASERLRLFVFGVGYDVDTVLLDTLAQEHHGSSTYVLPEERLDEVLSAFYARVSTPVLTDLELDFGSLAVHDLYPSPLPDLFRGSQIVLVGRYRQPATADLTLSGKLNSQIQTFTFPGLAFPASTAKSGPEAQLPRLWATRKIGHLLNEIRLHGANQEVIDQIVRLSIRYGIVTPYTSYLVTEDAPLGEAAQQRIVEEQYDQMQSMVPTVSGEAAVEKAAGQGRMADANVAAAAPSESAERIRTVGARTFVFSAGRWVDTAFDPQNMTPIQVAFLSPDYFALTAADPDLAAAFSLGEAVVVIAQGTAYEVVSPDTNVPPVDIPEAILPPTQPVPDPDAEPNTRPAQPAPETAPTTQPVAPANTDGGRTSLPCAAGWLPAVLPLALLFLRRRQAL